MKIVRQITFITAVLLLLFYTQSASGDSFFSKNQNKKIKISGVVTDANMRPIEGAIIFVDGVKTNSVTNSNGYYRVNVSPTAKGIGAHSQEWWQND